MSAEDNQGENDRDRDGSSEDDRERDPLYDQA